MRIGLIDVDGHNFPNLPLMKLSTYHKRQGDTVEWCIPVCKYDVVYKSKIFTFTPDISYTPWADAVIEGGTGYNLKTVLPSEIENLTPDNSLYPKHDEAYGFLTRGCPRDCPFCIVSKKEGLVSRQVADIQDFHINQRTIRLLDPNLLACKDHENILLQLAETKAWIDFTQGLDIRLITKDTVELLNKLRIKTIYFAWDNPKDDLSSQFQLFDKYSNLANYRKRCVYVLTNFNSTFSEDLERVYILRDMGFNPYVMIYDKENALQQVRDLQRWVNNRRIFRATKKFEEYKE